MFDLSLAVERERVLMIALRQSHIWSAPLLATFFEGCQQPERAAIAWAERHVSTGLLGAMTLDVIPTPVVSRPLHVHFHGNRPPDYDALAYQLEQRWSATPRRMHVYWPTRAFGRLHGVWTGADELGSPHKVSHDLLCSAVWVHYWQSAPDMAVRCWTPERRLQYEARRDHKRVPIPDALLESERSLTAVEIGGSYPADWLRHHAGRFALAGWNWLLW